MKSESSIRRELAAARRRLNSGEILGDREETALYAVIATLEWVANKTALNSPQGALVDAMVADSEFGTTNRPPLGGDDVPF